MYTDIKYLETHSEDPFYNLAFEEVVLRRKREGTYLILWQNDRTVVIGKNQNTEAEINRSFIRQNDIRVVRRITGGGAVYHDLGNLNYSFITDAGDAEELSIEKFVKPVVYALRKMGLDAVMSGRNDILIDGRKISGTAQRLMGDRILHHGTLLFDSDQDMISGALNADPEKFRSKSAKSVHSRIGNIRDYLKEDMDIHSFWNRLKDSFLQQGMENATLTAGELAEVKELSLKKYSTWEWNFGHSPGYDYCSSRRFPGGSLEVDLSVKSGEIKGISFHGDFMSVTSIRPLTDALTGCPFCRKAVEERMDLFEIRKMFGTITKKEVLELIFDQDR